MVERLEYGWVAPDPETGRLMIVRTEGGKSRLRVRPETVAPAETQDYRAPWRSEDGTREGEIIGKLYIAAKVLAAEVKLGAAGRPEARPIETGEPPVPGPGQRLVGPLYRIGPETITRYWEVEDRPLDELRAERVAEIKAAMVERINDRLLETDDAGDIRAAGRAALAAIADAKNVQAVAQVAVAWPGAAAAPDAAGEG
ncbi:hypothetical protein EDC65_2234 [Stella humosa]|uniref:Uncharacterized protein n=1 Tax=Stella humosa TaxID=94 RepID=A0A3N1MBK7_9PROT|nr:hypothetical protein [Stella humosa]ROQ00435.1 hypothetical protein EDC65_2234 [Stella humosa]BBK30321.1 hypothetical protein STHU_09550 [Stella humosa]